MSAIQFSKAVKFASKGRVALVGPAGAGKSYTMLTLATLLAGVDGKIAALDTEHGSLRKYADIFEFDVFEMASFSPQNFLSALHAAEAAGYAVFCADSLSHFWMGKDGALEFVDMASKRSKDQMSGWKDFRPHEREMIDAMIASPCHIICTMRTKTDYQETVDSNGKKKRVKIGLAPVQRDGLEYEFDLVGYMDDENTLIVDKSRCPDLTGKALTRPAAKDLDVFRAWLEGETRPVPKPVTPISQPRPQATAAPAPATPQKFSYKKPNLICTPTEVQVRQKKTDGSEFLAVKLPEKCEGNALAFCWHKSLFDAVQKSVNKSSQFEVELSGGYLNINDVLQVDGTDYRDGKPYRDQEAELVITDDDIPF